LKNVPLPNGKTGPTTTIDRDPGRVIRLVFFPFPEPHVIDQLPEVRDLRETGHRADCVIDYHPPFPRVQVVKDPPILQDHFFLAV
jgi:hypothetical protein